MGLWAIMGLGVISQSIATLGLIDGLVNIAKGTHHYFGIKLLKQLEIDGEKRQQIQSELEEQLERREKIINWKEKIF